MSELATTFLARPFAAAAELLAATPRFQSLVGAGSTAAALAFVDYPYRNVLQHGYRLPGGYLFDDPQFQHSRSRNGNESGQLGLVLSDNPSASYATDPENDITEWRNIVGEILEQMLARACAPKLDGSFYWHLTHVTKIEIDWAQKSEQATDDSLNPATEDTFRFALFVLDWV